MRGDMPSATLCFSLFFPLVLFERGWRLSRKAQADGGVRFLSKPSLTYRTAYRPICKYRLKSKNLLQNKNRF